MPDKPSCFVAYPSKPPDLAETIEQAIAIIRNGQCVDIDGWKSTSVSGKFIITAICNAIETKDIFIADLTNLNHNVLFELGFAIAKKKRIWILINTNIEPTTADYKKFKLLTTIGYSSYANSKEIVKSFYKDAPFKDLDSTIYRETIESVIRRDEKPSLFYIKTPIETDSSIKLARRVEKAHMPRIIDDPIEVAVQTLSWYAQKVYSSFAVIAHFLNSTHTQARFHNAKNSFVCGLAYGFGKRVLMLAHEPYESAIDYQDLLKTHRTALECESIASDWLQNIETEYSNFVISPPQTVEHIRQQAELENISIGDPVAEQELDTLLKYFIRTNSYNDALNSKDCLFVGRKGSGKTAIFYQLADEIGSDPRNHICIIKPIAYQLEGILSMLQQTLETSEKGYLIESFWKFLIYTELAKSIYENLQNKPAYLPKEDNENSLSKFVEENESLITPEFSVRLEYLVSKLQNVNILEPGEHQHTKISELIHDKFIARLRTILGEVLEKKKRVVILVDNLDKAWKPRENLHILCELLFGLLDVSQRISQEFKRSDFWRRRVNLSLIIFLRSDIFSLVIKHAREKDKITYSRIEWNDPELLLRVLEERFFVATAQLANRQEVWQKYFCQGISGMTTRKFLTSYILPRPRDLIYLCKIALAQATNRRHIKIEEEDIIEAQKKYSQFALDSIIVENSIQVETLEALLYEFVGVPQVIDHVFILEAMSKCGINESKLIDVIQLLCDLTFLGRETKLDHFEFLYNDEDKLKQQVMSRKVVESSQDKRERFQINKAFHSYLEIIP